MRESELVRRRRFDGLFETHGPDIVAYCRWRAASWSDAQDAAAEVFLTAWRRLDDVPSDDAARVWLYATARRVVANQRRSNRRRASLTQRLTVEAASAPVAAPDHDDHDALVRRALRSLDPVDREVLLLSEWEGLSPAEIAGVLGCLKVTARGRLHRARRRFRAAFEELSGVEGSSPRRSRQVFAKEDHAHV